MEIDCGFTHVSSLRMDLRPHGDGAQTQNASCNLTPRFVSKSGRVKNFFLKYRTI